MKTLHCRDAGFDCEAVIRANSEEEVMNQAAQHAHKVHGVETSPQMERDMKKLIREE